MRESRVEKCAVIIHEEAEGGFWGEVPALHGCYSQGESIDELMANVREAIAGVLEVMKERGARPEVRKRAGARSSPFQFMEIEISSGAWQIGSPATPVLSCRPVIPTSRRPEEHI
jgi:predicted RNase H-like HicB family nuclease